MQTRLKMHYLKQDFLLGNLRMSPGHWPQKILSTLLRPFHSSLRSLQRGLSMGCNWQGWRSLKPIPPDSATPGSYSSAQKVVEMPIGRLLLQTSQMISLLLFLLCKAGTVILMKYNLAKAWDLFWCFSGTPGTRRKGDRCWVACPATPAPPAH